jgi:hypothetical protein
MATLVFNAIGTAIGGPLGGAIGASFGQQIDRAALGGPPRQGPRLKELDVQLSSYGIQFPAIFGAMRVAGTVIWATDLIESEGTSGGGKSGPATIQYSYSANFAVALSSRPVARIGRIWADGKLLRGAAGDFKTETLFRFYPGHGDQALDSLIASDKGAATSPAHRGLAYVVFEGLQLADFGNRIPSLTFEVFEREAVVSVSELARAGSRGLISGSVSETVAGYALAGPNVRSAIAPLLDTFALSARVDGDALSIMRKEAVGMPITLVDPVASVAARQIAAPGRTRADKGKQPASVAIRYYDAARDYQSGVQRAGVSVEGYQEITVDLPAVLAADNARKMVYSLWLQGLANVASGQLSVPLGAMPLHIGTPIGGDGNCIVAIEHGRGFAGIRTSHWTSAVPALTGAVDGGEHVGELDALTGETVLALVDLPPLPNTSSDKPQLGIAAAGTGAGWRRAALSIALNGANRIELGRTASRACLGGLLAPLPPHPAHLLDMEHGISVELLAGAADFSPASGSPLDFAAPIINVGGEFLRYGAIEQTGERQFRLSKLLRGLWGTQMDQPHAAGAQIMVLDAATTLVPSLPALSIGSTAEIEATGIGDDQPAMAGISVVGRAITPLSPVHGRVEKTASGGLQLSWIRRSRPDTGWQDNVELPLGEETLMFDVIILNAASEIASFSVALEQVDVPVAQVAGWDLATGTQLTAKVRQVGQYARSASHDIAIML